MPIQVRFIKTSKDLGVEVASSTTLTVAFNVAQSSFLETCKSESANEAKPSASRSAVCVQASYWEIASSIQDVVSPGSGMARKPSSPAKTIIFVVRHPVGSTVEKKAE